MARHDASELAHRLARDAEAVCRRYLSAGRREGTLGVAVGAVVLAHGSPCAVGDVRANELSIAPSSGGGSLREPSMLSREGCLLLIVAAHGGCILPSVFILDARGAEKFAATYRQPKLRRPPWVPSASAYLPTGFSK